MTAPSSCLSRRAPAVRTAAVVFAALGCLLPAGLRAGQAAAPPARSKFHVELIGGFAVLDPADLNAFVDGERAVQEFTYDRYFEYLRAAGRIRSWDKSAAGEWKRIRNALPYGVRIRYSLLDFLDVSLGFQRTQRSASGDPRFRYARNELSDLQYVESLDYAPLALEARTSWPSLGVHVRRRIGRLITAEGYAAGGPLFAECSVTSRWSYLWTIQGPGYAWETASMERRLSESGSGTGFAFEMGARIGVPIFRGCDVFLEGGYAYQVAESISGPGSEIRGGDAESWEGEWRMRSGTLTTPWGTCVWTTPSGSPANGSEAGRFRLDLSGMRLRIGISLGI